MGSLKLLVLRHEISASFFFSIVSFFFSQSFISSLVIIGNVKIILRQKPKSFCIALYILARNKRSGNKINSYLSIASIVSSSSLIFVASNNYFWRVKHSLPFSFFFVAKALRAFVTSFSEASKSIRPIIIYMAQCL